MANLGKAEQAYSYVIRKLQSNPNFGKTLFYKVLYFSDFDFYELFKKSITGSDYRKIDNGPAPCKFDRTISSLKAKGYVTEKRVQRHGVTQIRYFVVPDVSFGGLSEDERKMIDKNIERLSGMNAKQVSAYSHQDMPYKATKERAIIDYDLVFYRNPVFSVAQA